MIVCSCTGTTDSAIAEMARQGTATVAEITRRTGAGGCCQPCRDEIASLLQLHAPAGHRRKRLTRAA
jgi:bacterioferritin-associated ferredoxin